MSEHYYKNPNTLRTINRRINQKENFRREALKILGIAKDLASPAVESFDFYKYALLLKKLKSRFDTTNFNITESNSNFIITIEHNGHNYVGHGENKQVAFSNVFSAIVLYELKISDENLCITTDNNKLTIKSEYIISSQVLKYAQYYKRLIHTLKPNFISKTGTEWQPIFTFSITNGGKTFIGKGQSKEFGTYDVITENICFKLSVDCVLKNPLSTDCSVSVPSSMKQRRDRSVSESSIMSYISSHTQNTTNLLTDYANDFVKILDKPREKKFCKSMGPTTYSDQVDKNGDRKQLFAMHIRVEGVKFSGTSVTRTKSDLLAALSAFKEYAKYHNSNNSIYESIVHELYEQMINFKENECETDKGICTTLSVKGQSFKGYGDSKLVAHKNAVASALSKFLNDFMKETTSSNLTLCNQNQLSSRETNSTLTTNENVFDMEKNSIIQSETVIDKYCILKSKKDIIEILAKPCPFRFVNSMGPIKSAPDGTKIYTMHIMVNKKAGETYSGTGSDQLEASLKAALLALKDFYRKLCNSNSKLHRLVYESLIHEVSTEMVNFTLSNSASEIDGKTCFSQKIHFCEKYYIGHGENLKKAFTDAIATALYDYLKCQQSVIPNSNSHDDDDELKSQLSVVQKPDSNNDELKSQQSTVVGENLCTDIDEESSGIIDKTDFIRILSKPRKINYWRSPGPYVTSSKGEKLRTMYIKVDNVQYSGTSTSTRKAQLIATLSAYKTYLKYHNTKNTSFRHKYDSLVHELHEQMRKFIEKEKFSTIGKCSVVIKIKNKTYNGNGLNREKAYEDAFASALVVIANDFISLSTSMPSNIEDKCENEIETIADESYLIPDFIDNLCYGIDFNAKPQNSTVSFINVVTEICGEKYEGRGYDIISASVGAISLALICLVEKCQQTTNILDGEIPILKCKSSYSCALISKLKSGLSFTTEYIDDQKLFKSKLEIHEIIFNGMASSDYDSKLKATLAAVEHCKNSSINEENQFAVQQVEPMTLLLEMYPSTIVIFPKKESNQRFASYSTTVIVNDRRFTGTGASALLSKSAAAKTALSALCNISYDSFTQSPFVPDHTELSQYFANAFSCLTMDQFNVITKNSNYNDRRFIASIIMIQNDDIDSAKVVAISTGTKVIGLQCVARGTSLNDLHAEIVARRSFINYLYTQLELHSNDETADDSIFTKPKQPGQFYQIKKGIEFHFYVNTIPCGDAAIFNPRDGNFDLRGLEGKLRAKTKSSEGTIPLTDKNLSTLDCILQETMSCSDKIACWNVLGVQGSLLSTIIEPIYLSSITIGKLFLKNAAVRAFYGRLETSLNDLPKGYKLNKPKLSEISSTESRSYVNTPDYCINWSADKDNKIEVIKAQTGKTVNGNVSQLAKVSFFQRYTHLMDILPNANELFHVVGGNYYETKCAARKYQAAKQQMIEAFKVNDLGKWLKKPIKRDHFMV